MKYLYSFIAAYLLTSSAYSQNPIRVDKGFGDPNETSICINKLRPNEYIGGSNIDYLYYSSDTGKSWNEYQPTSVYGIYGDPVLRSSNYGRVFYAHLSRNNEKSWPNWFDKIVVQYSDDGGKSFSTGASVGYNPTKMQDKPWLNIDEQKSSPFHNRVYVSWTEFDQYESADPRHKSNIKVSWSSDSGNTFSKPIVVSDISGGCLDDDNSTEGATTASLADGTLCLTWSAFGKIWFDKSKDGGLTWGKDKILVNQVGGWDMDIDGIYRTNGFAFLVVDGSNGPHKGRLYMFFGDKKHGDADEWIMWSDDAGENWSAPMRINTDLIKNGKDQFMGHFCIDPTNGNWYSIFYDRRHAESDHTLDLTLAWESGDTVYNQRLTLNGFPSPGKQLFFGDYIGIDAYDNNIIPFWTESKGELAVYALPINRDELKATSSSAQTIKITFNDGVFNIQYLSGVKGTVTVYGKKWRLFPTKNHIHLDVVSGISDNYRFNVKLKKTQKVVVDLSQPGTSIKEQSVWIIPNK